MSSPVSSPVNTHGSNPSRRTTAMAGASAVLSARTEASRDETASPSRVARLEPFGLKTLRERWVQGALSDWLRRSRPQGNGPARTGSYWIRSLRPLQTRVSGVMSMSYVRVSGAAPVPVPAQPSASPDAGGVSPRDASPGTPALAPEYMEHVVIDARHRFGERQRDGRSSRAPAIMTAVDPGTTVDFGDPTTHPTVTEGLREAAKIAALRLTQPVSLTGQAFGLWYWVPTQALSVQLPGSPPAVPFSVAGRSLFGLCVGRFELAEPGLRAEAPPMQGPPGVKSGDDALLELTLLALFRDENGFGFKQVGRMVDAGARHDILKRLAHKRPRELAYMQLGQTAHGWRVRAQGRTGAEALEIEVQEQSWLNTLGMGPVMGSLLTSLGTKVPLGGELANFIPGAGSQLRLGRLTRIHLPERIHLGLITPKQLLRPDLVTILPKMVVLVAEKPSEPR